MMSSSRTQVAYLNRPVQNGDVHLSAPFIYADALEELRPKPGMSFLNIVGGFLFHVLSGLCGAAFTDTYIQTPNT